MKSWISRPVPHLPGSMPALSLFDTIAGGLVTLDAAGEQSMYVCGITPYDATHMGHAASYVAFDLLNRAWRDGRQQVAYVQNVTDVDDPLLERATETGVDWRELAASQIELFRTDMEALNVLAPDHYVGAVESMPMIVPAIERLLHEGLAYRVAGTDGEPDGDVYYDVEAAGKHADDADAWTLGAVSGLSDADMLELFAERGGDPGRAGKRQALDPLLWRVAREGEPHWPGGELGDGRPGWHIECTVIAQKYLPAPFTVQGGGSDLVFPHHEMGAGHAYSLAGVPLARHFAHAGMVGLDGEKMSKSKGNLVLVSRLRAAGEDPAAIRLAILAHHYRDDWSWTDAGFTEAKDRLATWRSALDAARQGTAAALINAMRTELSNDLFAPGALAAVDEWAEGALADPDGEATASSIDAALVSDAVNALLGVEL
ncbi:cysteine--1-D-myo-inosityl 2-amino-2-deoxy-alpha-D-glucopyranoside ligase [Arthrobacter sp. PAMC25284]|uniref:cysteine--1-D-myo-inosityl 2-amino-2-deoxy-alpha-D-glucopyranoside ligase n=1 Tax=Arthrobacter sp. PAMC25284 TaxID=2861279 RepID=UPI001C630CB3|nr:cysteine--1-D-myo-inosityl 2-amino-2-deoxy-alpha-D-glucopyranoside ligase [Arthrobacter sp. PAMC25284]QYF90282.1 cysteine--1-D-myo-inosityl 2-amino-2-deoxy-alpha-D-glucopyranoside ligase [Arthrobacter sp. PAMC25284]